MRRQAGASAAGPTRSSSTMKLKTGIVGMPNVGKSTLFNAVTEAQGAMCANYPFATIEPNIGVVEVPDGRLKVLSDINKSVKTVPSTLDFYDIAGLVKVKQTVARAQKDSRVGYAHTYVIPPAAVCLSDLPPPLRDLRMMNMVTGSEQGRGARKPVPGKHPRVRRHRARCGTPSLCRYVCLFILYR